METKLETLAANPRITYRLATAEDVEAMIGCKSPHSVMAYVFFLDGMPWGLGGYKIENGNFVVFSDIKKDVKLPKMTIFRCGKKVMDLIAAKKLPMYVVADNADLIKRLGFEHYQGSVYKWQC